MPIYNAGEFLKPALESVLAQTTGDWKLIAVDDGSKDGSGDVVEGLGDPRIRLIRFEQNRGQTAALNAGLDHVTTKWVARLDQDDLAAPARLERQLALAESNPRAVLIGSWAGFIDETGAATGEFRPAADAASLRRVLLERPQHVQILHSSALFDAAAVRALGGYAADIRYAQDYALWLRLAAKGDLLNVPEVLVYVRRHPGQTSRGEVLLEQVREVFAACEAYGAELNLSAEETAIWQRALAQLEAELALCDLRDRRWRSMRIHARGTAVRIIRRPSAARNVIALGGATLRHRARRLVGTVRR